LTQQQREDDDRQRKAILQRVFESGQARLDAELARLRSLGVIDEAGNRISKEMPADMLPGSGCDDGI
jgi:hypothetical protein